MTSARLAAPLLFALLGAAVLAAPAASASCNDQRHQVTERFQSAIRENRASLRDALAVLHDRYSVEINAGLDAAHQRHTSRQQSARTETERALIREDYHAEAAIVRSRWSDFHDDRADLKRVYDALYWRLRRDLQQAAFQFQQTEDCAAAFDWSTETLQSITAIVPEGLIPVPPEHLDAAIAGSAWHANAGGDDMGLGPHTVTLTDLGAGAGIHYTVLDRDNLVYEGQIEDFEVPEFLEGLSSPTITVVGSSSDSTTLSNNPCVFMDCKRVGQIIDGMIVVSDLTRPFVRPDDVVTSSIVAFETGLSLPLPGPFETIGSAADELGWQGLGGGIAEAWREGWWIMAVP